MFAIRHFRARADSVEERVDAGSCIEAGWRVLHGTEVGVAHDDGKGRIEDGEGELDAAGLSRALDVCGDTDAEDFTNSAIEGEFDAEAGVGAGEDGREGALALVAEGAIVSASIEG